MIYEFSDTVPANTSKANRRKTVMKLTKGVITQVSWYWPPGTQRLGHATVERGINQIWPTNPEGTMTSDGELISFEEYYELKSKPYILNLYTWNEEDTYSHTFVLRFNLIRYEELPLRQGVAKIFERLFKLLERWLLGVKE